MKHDRFFREHPVFTGEELGEYLASRGEMGARTQESLLAYHRRTGRVVQVRRGLYAVIPPGADAPTYPIDPFLIGAKLTPDAVLSHHTALEFHGRAYSVHTRIIYSAARPPAALRFRSHAYQGARFPHALLRAGKAHACVVTAERAGMPLRVTSLERTLVDALDRPDLSGGWEEVWRSLESVPFFDLDRVVEYALLLGNATTAAKTGFFLEQHREPLLVEDRHLRALQELRPRQPHYLDRGMRTSGRLLAQWNLVVPGEVLDRAWGEEL